jgi:hypothetical protein
MRAFVKILSAGEWFSAIFILVTFLAITIPAALNYWA